MKFTSNETTISDSNASSNNNVLVVICALVVPFTVMLCILRVISLFESYRSAAHQGRTPVVRLSRRSRRVEHVEVTETVENIEESPTSQERKTGKNEHKENAASNEREPGSNSGSGTKKNGRKSTSRSESTRKSRSPEVSDAEAQAKSQSGIVDLEQKEPNKDTNKELVENIPDIPGGSFEDEILRKPITSNDGTENQNSPSMYGLTSMTNSIASSSAVNQGSMHADALGLERENNDHITGTGKTQAQVLQGAQKIHEDTGTGLKDNVSSDNTSSANNTSTVDDSSHTIDQGNSTGNSSKTCPDKSQEATTSSKSTTTKTSTTVVRTLSSTTTEVNIEIEHPESVNITGTDTQRETDSFRNVWIALDVILITVIACNALCLMIHHIYKIMLIKTDYTGNSKSVHIKG